MTLALNPPDIVAPTIEVMRALFTEFPSADDIATILNSCGANAASLDGVAEKFQTGHLSLTNTIGIAFKLLIEATEKGANHGIMGQAVGSAGSNQFDFFKNTDPGPDRMFVNFFSGGGNNNSARQQGSSELADGTERNFFVTARPEVAPANGINLYENGVLDNAIPATAGTGFQSFGGTLSDFTIGINQTGGSFFGKQELSRIAIWITHEPTAAEVTEWQALEAACNNPFFGEGLSEIRNRSALLRGRRI